MPSGGVRKGAGKPKGSVKLESQHTVYKNITIACLQEEYEAIKAFAAESGKTTSRFLIDSVLKN